MMPLYSPISLPNECNEGTYRLFDLCMNYVVSMSKILLMTFFQAAESPPEAEDVCGDTNGQRPKTISSAESFSSVRLSLNYFTLLEERLQHIVHPDMVFVAEHKHYNSKSLF